MALPAAPAAAPITRQKRKRVSDGRHRVKGQKTRCVQRYGEAKTKSQEFRKHDPEEAEGLLVDMKGPRLAK